ncbi:MAG: hypothetical protein GXY48_04095 [Methanomicrobiales archaeon]|nr:hypothetical protein [Methanomicrobiales archaeon]
MGSLFEIQENAQEFSDGFDLLSGRLSKSLILSIYSEYENALADCPNDILLVLDCEALLNQIREDENALKILKPVLHERKFLQKNLRYAAHCAALGNTHEMEETLYALLNNPVTSHEKACAFIAAGRLGNKNAVLSLWKDLLVTENLQCNTINEDVLNEPDSYTCISTLFLRERIEAIDLLFQYDISENRDIELYCHTSSLHYQIGLLLNPLLQAIAYDGEYSAFTGFVVANAIAGGAYELVKKLRNTVTTHNPRVFQELILNLEGIRRYKAMYAIGEGLLTFFSTDTEPDWKFVEKMMDETEGDICQIYDMLDIFGNIGLEAEVAPIIEILTQNIPDIVTKSNERKELEPYLGPVPPITL